MPFRRFAFTPIATAVLGLWLPFAHAQTPAAQADVPTMGTTTVNASADASAEGLSKPFAGGQVARGGRVGVLGNQDAMDTPFSSTSYTNLLIQDQQAKSVADVLLNDPAVRQARGFGNFQEVYIVRGFPVFSDDVAYNGLYGMLPRQHIAAEFFERVEVFRGANTFLNGAAPGGSGLGGAINLLPKRAPNEPLSRIGLGLQTGGQASLSADVARRFGPDQSTGIRLNAVRRDGGTGIDHEKSAISALGVGLDWRGRNLRLSADVGYQDYHLRAGRPSVTPAADLPIPAAPDAGRNFAQPWTTSEERDTFATFRGEFDFTGQVMGWVAGGVRRSHEDNVLANPAVTNAAGDTASTRFSNTREDDIHTAEAGLRAKFATGAIQHSVVASVASYRNTRRNAYAISAASVQNNLYSPFASANPLANGTGGFVGNALDDPGLTDKIDTSSLAIADTLSFAQDRLRVTLGMRSQTIQQKSYAYNTGLQSADYNQRRTTPVAGLVFKASGNTSLYANYIEGLVRGDTAPATFNNLPVTNAGQALAPYRSKQKEVGVKYDGGTFGASAALFSTAKPVAYVQSQTFSTAGEQRNRGLELSVFGEPARGLRLLGGLTLLDARQRRTQDGLNDGKDAIGVPGHQLNVGAEWELAGVNGLALNARLLHTGKQFANDANTQQVPAWSRIDVGARYLMDVGNGRLLTLRARLDNLLDTAYWASTGGAGSNYLVLGTPRTLVVSASVDF